MSTKQTDKQKVNVIDILIALLIVGILVSVAIPLFQADVKRKIVSEADATLAAIRTSLRIYYAEHGSYPVVGNYVAVTKLDINTQSLDLDGKYFPASAYTYQSSDGVYYTIRVIGEGKAAGINRQITQLGVLSEFKQ